MAAPPKLEPGDLTKDELLTIVDQIRDVLWPRSHSRGRDARTVDLVESILGEYHLRP